MVEFDQEFDEFSNSSKSGRNPSSPGELLDAFQAFSTVPVDFRLTYLLFLQNLDSSVISHALDLRYSEVEKRISETKDILLSYAISLVDAETEGAGISGNKVSSEGGSVFVRQMIDAVPEDHFEVFRRFRKKESVAQIAQCLNLTEENVVRFNRLTHLIFLERVNLAVRHLAEIDSNSPPPLDQWLDLADQVREVKRNVDVATEALDQLKSEAEPTFSRDELLTVEEFFYRLDAIYREVFELDAIQIDRTEIADILDIEPDTARIRLKKARRILVGYMERLIVSMLLNRMKKPNAPRMRGMFFRAAQAIYREIPESVRKALSLFLTTGYSNEEIALRLNLEEEEVEQRIKEAKKSVRKRVLSAGVRAARRREDIPTARKRVLTRLRYIMALRRGEQQNRDLEIEQALKPLDRLTESERYETDLLFESLTEEQQNAYALCKGLDADADETAEYLGCLESEVKTMIRSVHALFVDRLSRLIGGMLRIDTFDPDAPAMRDSAMETARIAWRFIGDQNEEFFRRYIMSGDSEQEIAAELGVDPQVVSDRLVSSRRMLTLRSEILLTSWLREKVDGLMRAERIFRAITPCPLVPQRAKEPEPEEPYDYNFFLNSELAEAGKSLRLIDYDAREAFILHIGAGLPKEEVAAIQKTSVEEVGKRLLDAREMIRQRMEQLILGMLRISWEMPHATRMEDTEFEAAKATFEFVPQLYRKIYFRYSVHGESVEEIAKKLHIRPDRVANRLLEADKIIMTRSLFMAAAASKGRVDGKPAGDELLGGPKQIRFPAEVWNRDPVETPVAETAQAVEALSPKPEPEKKKRRNPLSTLITSVGGLFTQMGAAAPGAETAAFSLSGMGILHGIALLASPVFFVLSFIITKNIYGINLIKTAQTLAQRQWLVKQLAYFYTTLFALPFVLIYLAQLAVFLSIIPTKGPSVPLAIGIVLCYFGINGVLLYRTSSRYHKWSEKNPTSQDTLKQQNPFSIIFWWVYIVDTGVISLFLGLFAQDTVFSATGTEQRELYLSRWLILLLIIGVLHAFSCLVFMYFYKISRDEAAFEKYPPFDFSKKSRLNRLLSWIFDSRQIHELYPVLLGMFVPVGGNIVHLLTKCTHPNGSLRELAFYLPCWILVWYWNVKSNGDSRWKRIAIVIVLQYALFMALRLFVYVS